MIVLLTGRPGIGKSTVVEKFTSQYDGSATWVVTSAIPRPEGGRAGFAAANSAGMAKIISHKTDIDSDVVIGENRVDIAAVDAMFAHALDSALRHEGELAVIDEIGPIQLLSPSFTFALERAFGSSIDLIATIHRKDDRLAEYRNSPLATLLEVTEENRDMLPAVLVALARNRQHINRLSGGQWRVFRRLLLRYAVDARLLQIQKLANNAAQYVVDAKVVPVDDHWTIAGRHGDHHVAAQDDGYICDCDLFNGKGKYAGNAGEVLAHTGCPNLAGCVGGSQKLYLAVQ